MFGAQLIKPGNWHGKKWQVAAYLSSRMSEIWGFLVLLGYRIGISGYCDFFAPFIFS